MAAPQAILDALAPLRVGAINMLATPERIWRAIRGARLNRSGAPVRRLPAEHAATAIVVSAPAIPNRRLCKARVGGTVLSTFGMSPRCNDKSALSVLQAVGGSYWCPGPRHSNWMPPYRQPNEGRCFTPSILTRRSDDEPLLATALIGG